MTPPLPPPSPLGYPLPFPVLEVLKVLGFTLHEGPMNLWYAGLPVVVLLALFGRTQGRRLASRLAMVMPIALGLGVNFGIIPLLFLQVVYYRFFYPATILIAWPWLAVVPCVLVAYYAAYVAARSRRPSYALAGAMVAAGLLVIVGFFFANSLSLTAAPARWLPIFRGTNVAGAVTGVALNSDDPVLLPRWLLMFGIALTTTAAYLVLDTAFFARREPEEYRAWAGRFAAVLYTVGLLWAGVMAAWYLLGALPDRVQHAAVSRPGILVLFGATAAGPVLVWVVLLLWRRLRAPLLAAAVGALQFAFLAVNAVSRQWVQNVELRPYGDLAAVPTRSQWGSFAIFATSLVLAVVISVWLVVRLKRAWWSAPEPPH